MLTALLALILAVNPMVPTSISLQRGPIALPQNNQTAVQQDGFFASAIAPTRKAWISIVSTSDTAAYLTAQVTSDDGATWTEVPGPAINKSGFQVDGTLVWPHGAVHSNIVYTLNQPNGSPGTLALYAFNLGSFAWSTVNAAIGTISAVGGQGYCTICGINANGYAVAYVNETSAGGGLAPNTYGVLCFNINGTAIGEGSVTDVFPPGNVPLFRFIGVASTGTVLFAFSQTLPTSSADLTIFSFPDGAAPAGCVITAGTSGAVAPDAANNLYGISALSFGDVALQSLQKNTGVFSPYNFTPLTANNNTTRGPLSYNDFLLIADPGGDGTSTSNLNVSWRDTTNNFSAPQLLFNTTTPPFPGDGGQVCSASLESATVSLGVTTLVYGVISNVGRITGVLVDPSVPSITSYYWQIVIVFGTPPNLTNPGDGGRKIQVLTPNQFDFCLHREYRLFCNIDYSALGCARLPKCFTVDEREWGDQA